jgi:hypothetical protein
MGIKSSKEWMPKLSIGCQGCGEATDKESECQARNHLKKIATIAQADLLNPRPHEGINLRRLHGTCEQGPRKCFHTGCFKSLAWLRDTRNTLVPLFIVRIAGIRSWICYALELEIASLASFQKLPLLPRLTVSNARADEIDLNVRLNE